MHGQTDRDWWLGERSYAGREHLDDDYVARYDAKAQFAPSTDVAALVSLGMDAASTVIDMGAGTGTFAFAAATATRATVTAVDVSPAMVAAMRHRLDQLEPARLRLRVVEAGFLSYHHEGDPVDFVFSRNALHQLPDFWKVIALRRVAAMLRPGGILRLHDLTYDLAPHKIDEAFEAWMAAAVDDPATGYTAAELAEHVRGEFSTFTWLLEPMLERTGFEILDRESRRSIYSTYTCRRSIT